MLVTLGDEIVALGELAMEGGNRCPESGDFVTDTDARVVGIRMTPGTPGYAEVLAMIAAQPAASPAAATPRS